MVQLLQAVLAEQRMLHEGLAAQAAALQKLQRLRSPR